MTLLLEREKRTEITRSPVRHMTEWVLGLAGVVAAAVGVWMYYVPTDWFLGNLVEGWYLGMFAGAGLLLFAAFAVLTRKAYVVHRDWTATAVWAAGFAIAALTGAVVFGLIWML